VAVLPTRRRDVRLVADADPWRPSRAPLVPATAPNPILSGNITQAPAPVRVLATGRGIDALARDVTAFPDRGGALVGDDDHGPRTLDALLLGTGVPENRRDELRAEASSLGIPVVEPGGWPVIDVREVNPVGWQRWTEPRIGVRLADGTPDHVRRAIAELQERHPGIQVIALLPPGSRPSSRRGQVIWTLPTDPIDRGRMLQRLRCVVDLPGLHGSLADRASWLVEVAARGVPVVASEVDELTGRLAAALRSAIGAADLDLLDSHQDRERISVDQRQAALRCHGSLGVWRSLSSDAGLHWPAPPTVSVLLATNRPDQLEGAIERIDRQSYPRLEIVVGLHGDAFGDLARVRQRLARRTTHELHVAHLPDDRPLGDLLNALTDAAAGELVAKMDDDDLYDVDHLVDLVDALRYSGATIVGKGAEFVYLEEIDTTIRRHPNGAESANRWIAGGTLMLGRDDLVRVGRWQRVPRSVDQRLIDDVERAGGHFYRTHGYGFVLHRRDDGHTWDVGVDFFLREAYAQWPGLALDVAGVR
jgi:hypothetical protein